MKLSNAYISRTVISPLPRRGEEGGGGGTPSVGLNGDVPLNRVWFYGDMCSVLNMPYKFHYFAP